MRKTLTNFWQKFEEYIAYIVAGLGIITYAIQSWTLIHTLASIVYDEGGYLARGYLLAAGKYWPYADYSIPLDHMPLSFLIPGYVQVLFGPGIRTGRYFSFGLGIIALVGLWIAARKLGGNWWAAIALWSLALTPAWIESHSLVYSQVLVFFFINWSFVFAIGENKKNWEIILASFIAGIVGMTRLNIMPVVLLLILYFFWQHGKKAGILSLIGGFAPIIFLNILYWPGILRMWAYYFPDGIIPLIDSYRFPIRWDRLPSDFSLSGWMNNPNHLIWEIIHSFWKGLIKNLFVIIGVLSSILLWPRKKAWKIDYHRRLSIFFFVTYFLLFLMHMWASLSGASCGFSCFKGYLMFFSNIGLFFIIHTFQYWEKNLPLWQNIIIGIFISYFLIELAHHNPVWQRNLYDIAHEVLKLKVPRMHTPGVIQLRRAIDGIFGIPWKTQEQLLYTVIYWALPLGFLWVFTPLLIRGKRKLEISISQFSWILLTTLLFFVGILSPLESIGGEINAKKCETNVLESYEVVGDTLKAQIPSGSKVYWAIKSWLIFLYLPDIEIYPPQTMIHYTFLTPHLEIDQNNILRFGYWNKKFKEQWTYDADFILVEGRYYASEWQVKVDSGEFVIVDITAPFEECRGDDSKIFVLQQNLIEN